MPGPFLVYILIANVFNMFLLFIFNILDNRERECIFKGHVYVADLRPIFISYSLVNRAISFHKSHSFTNKQL